MMIQRAQVRVALVIAASVALAIVVAVPARAQRTISVGTAREAWFHTATTALPVSPSLPVALPVPPTADPYPAGTLHVGVTGGQEDSRTYLVLDVSSVDASAIAGGRLTLPVAANGGARSVETAGLQLCRAGALDGEPRGSAAPPPAVDCSVSSPASYDAAASAFVADLAPFAGLLDGAIAIVPVGASTESAWHVAFFARDSTAEGAEPITATLTLADEEPVAVPAPDVPAAASTEFAAAVHPEVSFASAPPPAVIGPVASAPAVGAPTRPNPAATAPIVDTASDGFRYSIVFALPLLLLAGVPYFGYAFTRPVAGDQRRRASRALNSS